MVVTLYFHHQYMNQGGNMSLESRKIGSELADFPFELFQDKLQEKVDNEEPSQELDRKTPISFRVKQRLERLIKILGSDYRIIGDEYVWACPHCREGGADTDGDHFKFNIQKNKYKCFASEDHTHAISEKLEEVTKKKNQEDKEVKEPQGDFLLKIIEEKEQLGEIQLFHNELNESYTRFKVDDHFETWKCQSSTFKRYLRKLLWDRYKKTINSDFLKNIVEMLESKAIFEGQCIKLFNRVAIVNGEIWYDLTNSKWQAVKITMDNWEIVNDPPIIFRRHSHQQPQVEPVKGGKLRSFLKFINIKDKKQEVLLLVCLVSYFIPGFPHPALNVYGAQGSAKSTLLRLLKRLVDPSSIEVTSLKTDQKEFVQLLSHHWFIVFDNVSELKDEGSDALCRAVSGFGFSKRGLYTNDDDIIYSIQICIGINGINLTTSKPDLLERSILIELERITPENRKEEQEIFKEFEAEKPKLLGAIFDVISYAMHIKDSIKLPTHSRMADFDDCGCAIAEALGYSRNDFLKAYGINIDSQNDEVLSQSLVAQALEPFIEEQPEMKWEGTHSLLDQQLKPKALELNIDIREQGWPKGANKLSHELNRLKTNLAEKGIHIKKVGQRKICIWKDSKSIVGIVSNDTINDQSPVSSTKSQLEATKNGSCDGSNDKNDNLEQTEGSNDIYEKKYKYE